MPPDRRRRKDKDDASEKLANTSQPLSSSAAVTRSIDHGEGASAAPEAPTQLYPCLACGDMFFSRQELALHIDRHCLQTKVGPIRINRGEGASAARAGASEACGDVFLTRQQLGFLVEPLKDKLHARLQFARQPEREALIADILRDFFRMPGRNPDETLPFFHHQEPGICSTQMPYTSWKDQPDTTKFNGAPRLSKAGASKIFNRMPSRNADGTLPFFHRQRPGECSRQIPYTSWKHQNDTSKFNGAPRLSKAGASKILNRMPSRNPDGTLPFFHHQELRECSMQIPYTGCKDQNDTSKFEARLFPKAVASTRVDLNLSLALHPPRAGDRPERQTLNTRHMQGPHIQQQFQNVFRAPHGATAMAVNQNPIMSQSLIPFVEPPEPATLMDISESFIANQGSIDGLIPYLEPPPPNSLEAVNESFILRQLGLIDPFLEPPAAGKLPHTSLTNVESFQHGVRNERSTQQTQVSRNSHLPVPYASSNEQEASRQLNLKPYSGFQQYASRFDLGGVSFSQQENTFPQAATGPVNGNADLNQGSIVLPVPKDLTPLQRYLFNGSNAQQRFRPYTMRSVPKTFTQLNSSSQIPRSNITSGSGSCAVRSTIQTSPQLNSSSHIPRSNVTSASGPCAVRSTILPSPQFNSSSSLSPHRPCQSQLETGFTMPGHVSAGINMAGHLSAHNNTPRNISARNNPENVSARNINPGNLSAFSNNQGAVSARSNNPGNVNKSNRGNVSASNNMLGNVRAGNNNPGNVSGDINIPGNVPQNDHQPHGDHKHPR